MCLAPVAFLTFLLTVFMATPHAVRLESSRSSPFPDRANSLIPDHEDLPTSRLLRSASGPARLDSIKTAPSEPRILERTSSTPRYPTSATERQPATVHLLRGNALRSLAAAERATQRYYTEVQQPLTRTVNHLHLLHAQWRISRGTRDVLFGHAFAAARGQALPLRRALAGALVRTQADIRALRRVGAMAVAAPSRTSSERSWDERRVVERIARLRRQLRIFDSAVSRREERATITGRTSDAERRVREHVIAASTALRRIVAHLGGID